MYEHYGINKDISYDDWRKDQIRRGIVEPHIVGSLNLDGPDAWSTGIPNGGRDHPGDGWQRITWRELAERLGVTFDGVTVPPCFRWFPYTSWPLRIEPPCEGSMEGDDLVDLVDVLAKHSLVGLDTQCIFAFSYLTRGDFANPNLLRASLSEVLDVYKENERSPNNFWPEDHGWFVYTDWDLMGTKVSGSNALIADLSSNNRVETIEDHWSVPLQTCRIHQVCNGRRSLKRTS
jgi:hypothetical protein